MKRTLLSVKELAQELGISTDSVYRAMDGRDPGAQIARIIRLGPRAGPSAWRNEPNAMTKSQCTKRAIAGGSRRRAAAKRPRTVIRGLVSQSSK